MGAVNVIYKNTMPHLNYYARPLVMLIMLSFGILLGTIAIFRMIFKIGFFKTFSWKTIKAPAILHEPSNGVHSTFTTTDGVNLHMVSKGGRANEKVMLFVHGFPDCWVSWRAAMRHFSATHLCVALSMRGYADSAKPRGKENYALTLLINDLKETVQFLTQNKVVLVAHDWGGVIAWGFAALYPELVEKLVIMNAPHPNLFQRLIANDVNQFLRSWYIYFFQLPFLPEFFFKLGNFAFIDMIFKRSVKSGNLSDDEIEANKYYISQKYALTSMINYYRHGMRGSSGKHKDIAVIEVPTLVVWGEKDDALDVSNLDGLGDHVTNLEIVRIPNASHFVHHECPSEVNESIEAFLKM